jgi:hypothetical protein
MIRKEKKEIKLCPLLDRKCLKQGCEIYNDTLDRCDVSLIAYNLYRLSEVEKQRLGDDQLKPVK